MGARRARSQIMLGQSHTAGSRAGGLAGPRRSRFAAAFLDDKVTEGTQPCTAASAGPPAVIQSHIFSCFMACLSWRQGKNIDVEAALSTSLSVQLFTSLPSCLQRQGNERFFHYLENVVFSTSEGCQSHSPGEGVTMFSHGASAASVAGTIVAPEAPTRPAVCGRAQPGKQGIDTLAHAGKPGEHERDCSSIQTNTESHPAMPGWSTGMRFTPVHRPMRILEMPGEHHSCALSLATNVSACLKSSEGIWQVTHTSVT